MLSAVLVVCGLYVLLDLPLRALAGWAESRADSYPWRQEDYLRFLLPSLFRHGDGDWLLIAGPSEAREDWLVEVFEAKLPGMRVVQGGTGGGGFRDMLAALDYISLEHGESALPRALVVGITPRFVANLPRDAMPVIDAINRYSPSYRVRQTPAGPELVPKHRLDGLLARARFQAKQPGRYQAALCATALRALGGAPADLRARYSIRRQLHFCRSPDRFHLVDTPADTQRTRAWLENPSSLWPAVHAWDPRRDHAMVEAELRRLREFAARHQVALYVVNLPEHELNRSHYRPEHHRAYLQLVRRELRGVPFLDLRDLLAPGEFVDHAHARLGGAQRVSDATTAFIRQSIRSREMAVSGAGGGM